MPFDIEAARRAGASDAQIAEFLSKQNKFDLESARSAGATDSQVAEFLSRGAPAPAPEPEPTVDPNASSFMRGVKGYLPQTKEILGGTEALIGKAIGSDRLLKQGVEIAQNAQKEQQGKALPEETDFLEAMNKGIGAVLTDYLPYQMGQGVANLAETLAVSGAGAVLGSTTGPVGTAGGAITGMVGKELVKKGIKTELKNIIEQQGKEAGEKYVAEKTAEYVASKEGRKAINKYIGATAGLATQAAVHGTGETTGRVIGENLQQGKAPEDIDLAKVLPASAVHAVADFVTSKITLGALENIGEKASRSLIWDVTKRIAATGAKEVPAEEIQTMAERYGASLSLSDAEALKEYVNTAAASFAMSVVPGGIGGVKTHLAGNVAAPVKDELADEQNKKADEAALGTVGKDTSGSQGVMDLLAIEEAPGAVLPASEEQAKIDQIVKQEQELAQELAGTTAPSTQLQLPFEEPPTTKPQEVVDESTSGTELTGGRESTELSGESVAQQSGAGAGESVTDRVAGTGDITGGAQERQVKQQAPLKVARKETDTGEEVSFEKKVAKPIQFVKGYKPTATPSPENYLNRNSNYSLEAPLTRENGIKTAARDKAFDEFDSVAFNNGVKPAIQAKLNQFNQAQREKRATEEAKMKAQGRSPKDIKEVLNAKYPVYKVEKSENPEETEGAFKDIAAKIMSLDELVNIYKEHKGKKQVVEGGEARKSQMKDRDAFIASLTEDEQKLIEAESDKAFAQEVKTVFTNRQTSGSDKRLAANRAKVAEKYKNLSLQDEYDAIADELRSTTQDQSQAAIAEEIAMHESSLEDSKRVQDAIRAELKNKPNAKQKKALQAELAEAESIEDEILSQLAKARSQRRRSSNEVYVNSLRDRLAEIEQELGTKLEKEAVTEARRTAKDFSKTTVKSYEIKLDLYKAVTEKIEPLITGAKNLQEILTTLADRKFNDTVSRNQATAILKLISSKNSHLHNVALKATVQFGELPKGKDGMFDPATNTITLKGQDGKYTGFQYLPHVLMHELLHYLTDHVTTNEKDYLESIENEDRQKIVKDSLNRLRQNYRLAATKLGKKYHISSFKEFIAEAFSNPDFQADLAKIEQKGLARTISNLYQTIVRNITSALGAFDKAEEGAMLEEILTDIATIMDVPGKIKSKEVSYATAQGEVLKAESKEREVDLSDESDEYDIERQHAPKTHQTIKQQLTTHSGWRNIARLYQNKSYDLRYWQEQLDMSGGLISTVKDKINNIYSQVTLATGLAKNYFREYVANDIDAVNNALGRFCNESGFTIERALKDIHKIMEALHEPERRAVRYMLNVPLNNVSKVFQDKKTGESFTAADMRTKIVNQLKTNLTMSKDEAEALRDTLNNIVAKYADENGDSPIKSKSIDINSEIYSATGMNKSSIERITSKYESHPQKAAIDEVLKAVGNLNKTTIELNKIGNYYSKPVDNFVNFYGWQHYIPLKGIIKHSAADELLDFDGVKLGGELQEMAYTMDGRYTVSNNPIEQSMTDATRATLRASRQDLTQSIKNAAEKGKYNPNGQGVLTGSKVVDSVPFDQRDLLNEKYKGKDNVIFHYNSDGVVDVIEISGTKMIRAIRGTYRESNSVINIMNGLTSSLGMVHTRYNFNFAPMNFVRDILTNAWTMGAEMGPKQAFKFIGAISSQVVARGGMKKAFLISRAFANNDFKALRAMAKQDPYSKIMIEYIQKGGLVSYIASLSNKSNYDEIKASAGKKPIRQKLDGLNKALDIWVEMFEIASRSAAYDIKKQELMNVKKLDEESAAVEAAAYVKNLANFEQIGELGKEMGALYMFFRPSATGAVRAIEAIAPAFTKLEDAVLRLPSNFTEEQKATFKANYATRQRNARIMSCALVGLGALAYTMSAMTADDDDLGRNATLNDNMSQWTRFLRLHISDDLTLQIPWGFGMGALSAWGAQLSAATMGRQSAKDAMGNMVQILFDSFIPLPVSRMSPTDDTLNFVIDSVMPSVGRPVIEFALNKNGLGQDIYNDANRRMGDAFTGGDKIPEMYKEAALYMVNETNGAISISPNTLYFLANSYADGYAKILEEATGILDLTEGRKDFVYKTDIPLLGSFFGAKANVDSMEFSKIEAKILEKAKIMKGFEEDPEQMAKYMDANPMDEYIVEAYNNAINDDLKDLRAEANEVRRMKELNPRDKTQLLKIITLEQNIIKRNLIDTFKGLGLEP